jgi:endonuclease/exonuclease/phosphatase family metal-dependent hydrolase
MGVLHGAGGRGLAPALRVVSWNLWWRYGPWERCREAIAATLAGVAPDLCGLQEVWGAPRENLAAELAGRLGMHWCWAVAAQGREGLSLGNAILSRWPIRHLAPPVRAGRPALTGRCACS